MKSGHQCCPCTALQQDNIDDAPSVGIQYNMETEAAKVSGLWLSECPGHVFLSNTVLCYACYLGYPHLDSTTAIAPHQLLVEAMLSSLETIPYLVSSSSSSVFA